MHGSPLRQFLGCLQLKYDWRHLFEVVPVHSFVLYHARVPVFR